MRASRFLLLTTLLAALAHAADPQANPKPLHLLLTADSEGHVGPCQSCPTERGLGGLARRATLIKQQRAEHADLLLLEAGNFLAGPDTSDDNGLTYAAVYKALKYDAVNVSYRDLRFGRDAAMNSLATLPAVSANLLDAATGKALLPAFVVVEHGGQRVAVIGASELPPDMPHLKASLAGVRFGDPVEAVMAALPKAIAASDHVLLLYYGSADALSAMRSKLADKPITVLAGGTLAEGVTGTFARPAIAVEDIHGKYVARATLDGDRATIDQLSVNPHIDRDAAIDAILNP
ncbi:MAG: metallophosphoesterase [Phycisphaerales bacterium]|nr:metallophosphoesterase [Phycisphaerales bacterium]